MKNQCQNLKFKLNYGQNDLTRCVNNNIDSLGIYFNYG